jgi:DNA-binding transcriptional LysR family regulator
MHIRTLELFCSIAEHRSFSRAAISHSVTQSAASQAVSQLESVLGIRLVDRSKRPLVLTPAGEIYFSGLIKLLRGLRRLEQDVKALNGRLEGMVSVAAIYSLGSTYMPIAREIFRRTNPHIEVTMDYGSSDAVARLVEHGEADLGLVSYPKSSRKLRFIPWLDEQMHFVASKNHELSKRTQFRLTDAIGSEFVGFESGLKIRKAIDSFLSKRGVFVNVTMEFDNIDSIIRAVQANEAITILPVSTVRKECADGSLQVLSCDEVTLSRPLGIILPRSGGSSRVIESFVSMLTDRQYFKSDDRDSSFQHHNDLSGCMSFSTEQKSRSRKC